MSNKANLTWLKCENNKLKSLDVTKNPELVTLDFSNNEITSIDISKNIKLTSIGCSDNELTELDSSENILMVSINCSNNKLVSLNLNKNSYLKLLLCNGNELTHLSVKNGENSNILTFLAQNNPDLKCINVDDASYSTANWTNIDSQTVFSENCSTLNNDEFELAGFRFYPNPVRNILSISIQEYASFSISNSLGQTILTGKLGLGNNTLNLETLTKGPYYLTIKTETALASKKLMKY